MPEITHLDALLLYVVAYCSQHEGVATLYGIYAASDAIERIAPTFDDLQSGLTKLLNRHLLIDEGDDYLPTDKGLSLYLEVNKADGNVFHHLDLLENKLNVCCTHPGVIKEITLDPVLVEKARRAYYEE